MKRKNKKDKKQEKQIKNEMLEKFDVHKVPEFLLRFRGYDRNEVNNYLNFLVDAYLKLYDDYTILETEVNEYRENKTAIADLLIDAKAAANRVSFVAQDVIVLPKEKPPEPYSISSIEDLLAELGVDESDKPFSAQSIPVGRSGG